MKVCVEINGWEDRERNGKDGRGKDKIGKERIGWDGTGEARIG